MDHCQLRRSKLKYVFIISFALNFSFQHQIRLFLIELNRNFLDFKVSEVDFSKLGLCTVKRWI